MPMKKHPREKSELHPRNPHRRRYDFAQLIRSSPDLAQYVSRNAYGDESVDFFDPDAVMALNRALLRHFYHVRDWRIPRNYLCPPIPGRADYIHYIADLLASSNRGVIPTGPAVRCLDVGVGASCVYPIIGVREYGWSFTGTEFDPASLASAGAILAANPQLGKRVDLRRQRRANDVFRGILTPDERYDVTICNPPFHASAAEARAGAMRKLSNLKGKRTARPVLNFGGQRGELWCEGGEAGFIRRMIIESRGLAGACLWFSTLVSKKSNLGPLYRQLTAASAADVRTIEMSQGSKSSRIVAWTFCGRAEQDAWRAARWR
jgi:23S rRNA (adenine1618-N6)-methyltransferase